MVDQQQSIVAGKWERRQGLVVEELLPTVVGNTKEQSKEARESRIRKEMEEEVVPSKLFRCFFCGKQFNTKRGTEVHLRTCDEK